MTSDFVQEVIDYYARLEAGERATAYPLDQDTPWERLRALAQETDPEQAWQILLALLERVPDSSLTYVAAGPLEDLISFHGADFISRLEELARTNTRLLSALECVIVDPWVEADVKERLRRLCPLITTEE